MQIIKTMGYFIITLNAMTVIDIIAWLLLFDYKNLPIAFHSRIFPQSINNNEPEINEKNKKRYYLEYELITRDTKFQLGAHYLKKNFFKCIFKWK